MENENNKTILSVFKNYLCAPNRGRYVISTLGLAIASTSLLDFNLQDKPNSFVENLEVQTMKMVKGDPSKLLDILENNGVKINNYKNGESIIKLLIEDISMINGIDYSNKSKDLQYGFLKFIEDDNHDVFIDYKISENVKQIILDSFEKSDLDANLLKTYIEKGETQIIDNLIDKLEELTELLKNDLNSFLDNPFASDNPNGGPRYANNINLIGDLANKTISYVETINKTISKTDIHSSFINSFDNLIVSLSKISETVANKDTINNSLPSQDYLNDFR